MLNLNLLVLIFWKKYLRLIIHAKIHLDVMNLKATIKEENCTPLQDRTKAFFIYHFIDDGFKVNIS